MGLLVRDFGLGQRTGGRDAPCPLSRLTSSPWSLRLAGGLAPVHPAWRGKDQKTPCRPYDPRHPARAAAHARQGRPTKPRTSPFRHWWRLSRSPLTRATTAAKTLGIQGLHDAHRDVRDTQPERRQGHEDLRVQGPVGRRHARAPRARRLSRRLARRAGAPRGRRLLGAVRHPHREPLRRAQPERVVRLRGHEQHAHMTRRRAMRSFSGASNRAASCSQTSFALAVGHAMATPSPSDRRWTGRPPPSRCSLPPASSAGCAPPCAGSSRGCRP